MDSGSNPENQPPETSAIPPEHERFLEASGIRMDRFMWALGLGGTGVCAAWGGWRSAAGFAAGAVLSALNFHWLRRAVASIAEAIGSSSADAPSFPAKRPPGAF